MTIEWLKFYFIQTFAYLLILFNKTISDSTIYWKDAFDLAWLGLASVARRLSNNKYAKISYERKFGLIAICLNNQYAYVYR